MTAPAQAPDCKACRHYFVTHELARRHGCHAMGFKSARLPAQEVFAASGEHCLRFESRAPRPPGSGG
jgi:hypothetical protein